MSLPVPWKLHSCPMRDVERIPKGWAFRNWRHPNSNLSKIGHVWFCRIEQNFKGTLILRHTHTLVLSGVQYNKNSFPSLQGIDGCVSSLVSEIPYSVILSCQVLTVILCFWICIYICSWFSTVSLDVTCICFMLRLEVGCFYISCCIAIWDHVPPN